MTEAPEQQRRPDAWPAQAAIGRRFEGKVAFVTGGASGLGRAAAERFAREGARVVVADLDRSGAETVAATLPDALAVHVDTADGAAVDRSFEVALESFGLIDVIFNNAGVVGPPAPPVAPTAVMTELVAGHIARAPDPDAMRRLLETQTPIPGMPTPEDVAAVVAFLASDDARWITGHTLPIDGGFHAQ
jgi:NAD(P)-dependent dehydrogenase (short-subunit alcohol dehydrogenase family)